MASGGDGGAVDSMAGLFVERSRARIRFARRVFLVVGVAPLAGLMAWAMWSHGDARRARLEARVGSALSLPVSIARVRDARPGVMILDDVALGGTTAAPLVRLARVRVEEAGREIRLEIESLECPPAAAALFARITRRWLAGTDEAPHDWIVECARVGWGATAAAPPLDRVRVECVTASGSRGVWIRAASGAGRDHEIRVRRHGEDDAPRYECVAFLAAPLPLAVVGAGLGLGIDPRAGGATCAGEWHGVQASDGWTGHGSGSAMGVDLAVLSAPLPDRLSGIADIVVDRVDLVAGRVREARFQLRATDGTVGSLWMAAAVDWLGCRPLAAWPPQSPVPFRGMAWSCRLGPLGIELDGMGDRGSLCADANGPLLAPPPGPMPVERLAWLGSPPGLPVVPASRWTAWLLPWLPPLDAMPPADGARGPGDGSVAAGARDDR